MAQDIGNAQGGNAWLPGSNELAWAAQLQVYFGNKEAVRGVHKSANAFSGGIVNGLYTDVHRACRSAAGS